MNKNILEYKGYHSEIHYVAEDGVLRGVVEGINDYIDFESKSVDSIEEEFHLAVDDYIEFCEEVGKPPEKEYKGTFNVRIKPSLHKGLAVSASKNGRSLNNEIEKAVEFYLAENNAACYNVESRYESIRLSEKIDK